MSSEVEQSRIPCMNDQPDFTSIHVMHMMLIDYEAVSD